MSFKGSQIGGEKIQAFRVPVSEQLKNCRVDPDKIKVDFRKIIEETPLHQAVLGDIGDLYGIPKPVSAVIKSLLGDEVVFLKAAQSPVGSPAVCLASMLTDKLYWAKFRKSLSRTKGESRDFDPFEMLGIAKQAPFNVVCRVDILAAYALYRFGTSMVNAADLGKSFLNDVGFPVSAFFGGSRLGAVADLEVTQHHFASSWSRDAKPILYMAAKNVCDITLPIPQRPDVVSSLVGFASKNKPELINFDFLSKDPAYSKFTPVELKCYYLLALGQAVRLNASSAKRNTPANDELGRELLAVARDLSSAAQRLTALAEKLILPS